MNKKRFVIKFLLLCFAVLMISFAVHSVILQKGIVNSLLITTYLFNFILYTVIIVSFYFLEKNFKDHLSFLYLFLMFIKLLIVYFVFYKGFKVDDGIVSKTELTSVFIPYSISLFLSIKYLSKTMNTNY